MTEQGAVDPEFEIVAGAYRVGKLEFGAQIALPRGLYKILGKESRNAIRRILGAMLYTQVMGFLRDDIFNDVEILFAEEPPSLLLEHPVAVASLHPGPAEVEET